MTPELDLLRQQFERLSPVVSALELELVDDPSWDEPSDTSYLNDKDRADPDIMANTEAMLATNRLISWFGKDLEGYVGLWRGPKDLALANAPVVRLDTEGQYELVATAVGDYLAVTAGEEDFHHFRERLLDAGFRVSESIRAIQASVRGLDGPNEYRRALYNEGRMKRGLKPFRG